MRIKVRTDLSEVKSAAKMLDKLLASDKIKSWVKEGRNADHPVKARMAAEGGGA